VEVIMSMAAGLGRVTAAAAILFACHGVLAAEGATGTADRPVEIEAEPMHSIRLVNPVVRVYDAVIPPESQTLFHTHRYSGVGIEMTATRLYIEKVGANPNYETTKAGDIFPVDSATPYIHRVATVGDAAYRAVVAELIQPPGQVSAVSTVAGTPPYTLELENERVRVYRLVLQPGEAVPLHTLAPFSLTVTVSGGQVSVASPGAAARFASLAPGALEWNEKAVVVGYKNIGSSTYNSVYFEWKSATP
jgi:quercetin dioxygenase-like cupin family protein